MSVQAELFYDGAWQQVDAYADEGWRYRVGPSPNDPYAPASTALELALANDDLQMDPSRVDGALYGKIGRNTPARLVRYDQGAITVADTFNGRTVASGWGTSSSGTAWTTSGGSASDYSVSAGLGRMSLGSINTSRRATLPGTVGGGDARLLWTIPVDPTGDDIETTLMIHYQDASNYVQASIYWDRDGRPIELQFVRRVAGVVTQQGLAHLTVSPVEAGLSCWMRVRWFGLHMSMKVWPAADVEPDEWTLSAVSPTTNGWTSGQVGIRANLQPLFAGSTPVVVTVDQFELRALDGHVLTTVEASSWSPERTVEHVPGARKGRSFTDFAGEGFIRRLGLWDDLESPIRGWISKTFDDTLLGYYTFEEPDGAQYFANYVPGTGAAGYEGDVTLGRDGSGGSAGAFELGADGAVRGSFATSSANGYQIAIDVKLAELPTSSTYIAMWQWVDSAGRYWYWRVNDTSFMWEIAAADGTSIKTSAASYGTTSPDNWLRLRMKVTVSGSTVTYEPAWYKQDNPSPVGITDTFTSSTAGRPRSWAIIANAYTDGALFEHLFATSDTSTDLLTGDAARSFNGFNGETAFSRFVRIVTQARGGYLALGDTTRSPAMGRQPIGANPIEVLAECAATDAGLIYDDPSRLRLVFRMNTSLINQLPVLALTRGVDVAPPLRPIIDDTRAANDLRVENWDGTEARVVQTTGPRSVQNPPAGAGRNAGRLAVSFQWAGQLEQRGNWELRQNTTDRPRYGQVTVDLQANPEYRDTIDNMRPGDLITLDGVEPDTVPLLVLQLDRSGSEFPDRATFNCVPADLYLAGEFDDGLARYDSASTTLAEDLTTTETIWDLFVADPADRWRPGSGGWDVVVGGERCTVTNVTTGAASGDGWAQTMTCTRSVNGVVKTHDEGDEVHIYLPARYTLRGTGPI